MATSEDRELEEFGYSQQLDRAVTPFASFCVGFALISATTAVYAGFGFGLATAGPAFVWTVPVVFLVFAVWAAIAADLAVKLPLAGYVPVDEPARAPQPRLVHRLPRADRVHPGS
jgi:hypothetical protein